MSTTHNCEYRKSGCHATNSVWHHFRSLGYVTHRFADNRGADFAEWDSEVLDHGILYEVMNDVRGLCTAEPNVFTVHAETFHQHVPKGRPAFSFAHFFAYSHNVHQRGWLLADGPLYRLLKGENSTLQAERDFVYLMSDHGACALVLSDMRTGMCIGMCEDTFPAMCTCTCRHVCELQAGTMVPFPGHQTVRGRN